MNSREINIRTLLNEIGVCSNYKGHKCILHGLLILIEDEERLYYISKDLYVDIGKQCRLTSGSVERNIRTVKNLTWKNKRNHPIFQYCDERPNNGQFLALLLHELRIRHYEQEQKNSNAEKEHSSTEMKSSSEEK